MLFTQAAKETCLGCLQEQGPDASSDCDGATAALAAGSNGEIDVWLRMPLRKLYVLVCIALTVVLYLTSRSRGDRQLGAAV